MEVEEALKPQLLQDERAFSILPPPSAARLPVFEQAARLHWQDMRYVRSGQFLRITNQIHCFLHNATRVAIRNRSCFEFNEQFAAICPARVRPGGVNRARPAKFRARMIEPGSAIICPGDCKSQPFKGGGLAIIHRNIVEKDPIAAQAARAAQVRRFSHCSTISSIGTARQMRSLRGAGRASQPVLSDAVDLLLKKSMYQGSAARIPCPTLWVGR